VSSDDLPPENRPTLDYRNPQPDPKPPPIEYARYVPRPTPTPNPMAAFALMLAFFNILWTVLAIGLMFSRDLAGIAWLLPPGVLISSASGFLMARAARREGLRTAALSLNAICFIVSAISFAFATLLR
jgi:hypothetical protein